MVDPTFFYLACVYDVCSQESSKLLCDHMEMYVQRCIAEGGLARNWWIDRQECQPGKTYNISEESIGQLLSTYHYCICSVYFCYNMVYCKSSNKQILFPSTWSEQKTNCLKPYLEVCHISSPCLFHPECPEGSHYVTNFEGCPKTCQNPFDGFDCPLETTPLCVCPEGQYLDRDTCVTECGGCYLQNGGYLEVLIGLFHLK